MEADDLMARASRDFRACQKGYRLTLMQAANNYKIDRLSAAIMGRHEARYVADLTRRYVDEGIPPSKPPSDRINQPRPVVGADYGRHEVP